MEIKDFITQTVQEIEGALKEVSNESVHYELDVTESKGIHFSLAVTSTSTAEESGSKGAGARIKILSAGIDKSKKEAASEQQVSRIEFNIRNRATDGGHEVDPSELTG